ncbi:MAG: protease, partial [Gemmatimonadetes bacterium]|nr:protease [Gemmatimonadota bacterium]
MGPWLLSLALCVMLPHDSAAQGTRLLRHPTVSRDQVAFQYGGDLWIVSRAGGRATRLTATPEVETDPHFSPDGSMIAFTATVAGNTDVYVVSSQGGQPRRLTYHPEIDRARGWTPDGRSVVFASTRENPPQNSFFRLFLVPVDGGLPQPLPLPRATMGAYAPDGSHVAYQEIPREFMPQWHEASFWRHYRGGRTEPIRVFDPTDASVTKLPWTDSNDSDPMWIGNTIYFLSDRDFTTNVFAYRTDSKELTQLTHHDDFDVMNATAGPDAVAYEQAGYIHLLDTRTGRSERLNIDVSGEFSWAQPQFKSVADMVRSATLSPTGVRVVLEARGDIFTVPVDKGDYRNLTNSPGVHDEDPVWSPDGTQLAWLSDGSGEFQLMIGDQTGIGEPRVVSLPTHAFPSDLAWSPDGNVISFQDSDLILWTLDVKTGKATKVDTDTYDDPGAERGFGTVWSPDSRWIAYSKSLDNHFRAIFLHSLADGKTIQLTDGLSDAVSPAFDAGGKYLYFLASTDYGPATGWLEMSSTDRPVRRSIYLAVLAADQPSPFLPESGDEPGAEKARPAKPTADSVVRVDVQGIDQRILSLAVPARDYHSLQAGDAGTIFYLEAAAGGGFGAGLTLQRYRLRDQSAKPFLSGVQMYTLSADHKKLLYAGRRQWGVVSADAPTAKVGDGSVNVAQLRMRVDPQAEWPE